MENGGTHSIFGFSQKSEKDEEARRGKGDDGGRELRSREKERKRSGSKKKEAGVKEKEE